MTDLTGKLRQHAENRKRLGGHPCGYDFLLEAADLIESRRNTILTLRQQVRELETQVKGFEDIVSKTTGVVGWYLYGEVATWEELGILKPKEQDDVNR